MSSATLVAVIVNDPAVADEKVTDVVVWFASDPPVAVQVTPALPTSFVTVALSTCVCDIVSPPSAGLMETVIVEGCASPPLQAKNASSPLANKNEFRATELTLMSCPLRDYVEVQKWKGRKKTLYPWAGCVPARARSESGRWK